MTPDAFVLVARALRARWLADGASWPAGTGVDDRTRNLMLDACGSDHRALVELVLTVGPELRASLPHPAEASAPAFETGVAHEPPWPVLRAPLVHRLVATRFLQTDIARWLVDCWAFAIGVNGLEPASPAVQRAMPEVAWSSSAPPSNGHATAARRNAASSASRAQAPGVLPSIWRGAAPSASRAARVAPHGAAAPNASRLSATQLAKIARMERVGLTLLASSVLFAFIAHGYAMWAKPLERERAQAAKSVSVLGASHVDDANVRAMSAPVSNVGRVTTNGLDDAVRAPLTVARYSGRYRVSHQATSVTGGDGCDVVASALARRQTTIETIEHRARTATVYLASRDMTGAVSPDGQFRFGPDSGTTNGVRWTFVMRGRFSDTGFIASSQKTTDAIMKWSTTRSCAVVADLVGDKLSP